MSPGIDGRKIFSDVGPRPAMTMRIAMGGKRGGGRREASAGGVAVLIG
jgi:hypothetical protein